MNELTHPITFSEIEKFIRHCLAQKKPEKAINILTKLISDGNKSDKLYELLAYSYFEAYETEKAENNLLTALKINPSNVRVINELIQFYSRKGNLAEIRNLLNRLLQQQPENKNLIYELVQLELKSKNYEDGIKLCNKILDSENQNIRFLELRHFIFTQKKDYVKAIEDAHSLLEKITKKDAYKNPFGEATYLQNLGFLYSLTGNVYKAKINLQRSLSLVPEQAFATNNLGYVYYLEDDYQKALETIGTSLKLDPSNAYAYKNRALVYIKIREMEKAKGDLLKAKLLGYSDDFDSLVDDLLNEYFKK